MSEVRREGDRYVLATDAGNAVAVFEQDGDVLTFTHTVVPPEARGGGVASRLIAGALADVRARGERIVPQCPYVAAWLERHPPEQDLVAD